jgi:hypothetical protein
MEVKRLTVSEYATLTGKTKQSIYKRIRKGNIKTIEEVVNGKKILFVLLESDGKLAQEVEDNPISTPPKVEDNPISTPPEVENNPDLTHISTPPKVESNPNSTQTESSSFQFYIEVLQKQLEEKDRQIERLQEQNREQAEIHRREIEELHRILDQEQKLHAASIKYLPAQETPAPEEEHNREVETPPVEVEEKEPIEQEQEPPKKKGFFSRLFHK